MQFGMVLGRPSGSSTAGRSRERRGELHDALVGYAPPLVAAVPAAHQRRRRRRQCGPPYIAFSKQLRADDHGVDGTWLAAQARSTAKVRPDPADQRHRRRCPCARCAALAGMPAERGGAGYDAEERPRVEIVTVDWFDVWALTRSPIPPAAAGFLFLKEQ